MAWASMITLIILLGLIGACWLMALWLGGAFLAAWVAGRRNRDPVAWWVIGFFLSPLFALLALNAAPPLSPKPAEGSAQVRGHRSWHAESASFLDSGV
jgi:hypothetical protein